MATVTGIVQNGVYTIQNIGTKGNANLVDGDVYTALTSYTVNDKTTEEQKSKLKVLHWSDFLSQLNTTELIVFSGL